MMHTLRFLSKSRSKGKSNKNLQSTPSLVSLAEEQSDSVHPLPTTKPYIPSTLATSVTRTEAGTNSSLESFSDGVAQSFYTTPPRSTAQSQLESEVEKEEVVDDTDYAVVRPVDEKHHDGEWTQLELAPPAEDSMEKRLQQEVDAAIRKTLDETEVRIHAMEQRYEEDATALKEESIAARKQTQLLERALDRDKQRFEDERESTRKQIQGLEAALNGARNEIAHERQSAKDRIRSLEENLAQARQESASKSEVISKLRSTVTNLQSEVDYLSSQNISLTDEASAMERRLADETQRLQRVLDDEKSGHSQRVQGLHNEIKALEKKNNEQKFTILELEDTMAHVEEEARTVRTTNKDLRSILARYEGKMTEDKAVIDEKNGRIDMLSRSSTYMTAELVQLQETVNASNRQNSMLVDQLRQQSSDILAAKGLNRPNGHAAKIGRGFQGGNTIRVDAAIRTANLLNEEVFQICASMTDQLENIAKRFVVDDGGRLAMAENLKPLLGTELVRYLQRQAQEASPAAESKLAIIQVALQGCLIACCTRIITSWYPNDWEYGDFLAALYERIRGARKSSFVRLSWNALDN